MEDAPYVGDLDLDAISTHDELAALLRTVHVRSDKPSLRTIEARTRHSATFLSKTATAEMLRGVRLPRKAVMLAFLQACGIPEEELEVWRRTWERIAAREEAQVWGGPDTSLPHADAAEMQNLRQHIERLNRANETLRAQLTTTKKGTAKDPPSDDPLGGQRAQSSAVRRRELSIQLRALRAEAGMTVEQVSEHLMCSLNKVRRMESGFRAGTVRDVRDLCDFYGVTDSAQRDHLMDLARPSRQPPWYQAYGPVFSTYLELESDARTLRTYESTLVAGLLQTEDYARAVLLSYVVLHPDVLSADIIEQKVEGRLARQQRLIEADPPHAWFILHEAALHRMVGSPVLMVAQLERLIEVAQLPNVTIQILSYDAAPHPIVDISFAILDFSGRVGSLAYEEGFAGALYFERHRDVEQYIHLFDALQAVAMKEQESVRKIVAIKKAITY
jgi:transcriptional regulator with XRE-family HTH domain